MEKPKERELRQTVLMSDVREAHFQEVLDGILATRPAFAPNKEIEMIQQLLCIIKMYHQQIIKAVEIINELTTPEEIIEETQTQKEAISKHL